MTRCLLILACVLSMFRSIGPARAGDAAFYQVSTSDIAGQPGTIVRSERIPAPAGASAAYKILYRSRDHSGRPIVLSGVAAIPLTPPGRGGRPVVSWAHGTAGIAARCAPSSDSGVFRQIAGFADLMAFGAVVVATDYHGLGVNSRPGYLVSASEGHAVIDVVRAARSLPDAHAGRAFAAWGWSQGAHAALAVAAIAGRYAPDLTLVGVAAASPPTDLRMLLRDDVSTPAGQVLLAYAISSWSQVYGVSTNSVLAPAAGPTLASIAGICSRNVLEDIGLGLTALSDAAGGLLNIEAIGQQPWRGLIAQNSLTTIPSRIPIFIAQGLKDTIIEADVTREFVRSICRSGAHVSYVEYPLADHGQTARRSAQAAVAWMRQRFEGAAPPPPSDCSKLNAAFRIHSARRPPVAATTPSAVEA